MTTIINTHTHGDHVSGNVEFPATVDFVVQENTKANMEEMRTPTGIATPAPNIFTGQAAGHAEADVQGQDDASARAPTRSTLYYFGRGHTNGDAWVVFPALRVMHAGDIFSGKNLPLLDANNGGSGVAIGDSLQKAVDTVKNVDTDHHRPQHEMTRDDLKEYAAVQSRIPGRHARGEEGRQDRRRSCQRLEDAGEIRRLRHCAGAPESERAGALRRNEVGRIFQ